MLREKTSLLWNPNNSYLLLEQKRRHKLTATHVFSDIYIVLSCTAAGAIFSFLFQNKFQPFDTIWTTKMDHVTKRD